MRCEKIALSFLSVLIFVGTARADFVSDSENLRKRLFAGTESKASCSVLSRGPYVNLKDTDAGLDSFVSDFLTKLKGKDAKVLPLFHDRLRLKADFGEQLYSSLKQTYKEPWDFSVFRIFGLNTVNGDKQDLPCADEDVLVTTAYGYPFQVGVWIQLLSQSELGRIFAVVAPTKDGWKIVGLHMQQWTQSEKDFEAWIKQSNDYAAKGTPHLAYLSLDVSQKMLFGGDLLTFPLVNAIIAERDKIMTKEALRKKIGAFFPDRDIAYAGTALAEDGPGWVIRERITQEKPTNELMKRCLEAGKKLQMEGWISKNLGGLNCNYVLPGEAAEKPGKLGGFYFSQKDILTKKL
ncbi:MAG: hypothetical protein AB7T49_16675 [Oligoflexales bacterium]